MLAKFADLILALRSLEESAASDAPWASLKVHAARLGASMVLVMKEAQVRPFGRMAYSGLSASVMARLEANERAGGAKSKRVVLRSPEPFLISKASRAGRAGKPSAWYATLRRVLSKDAVFVVPAHRDEAVVCIVTFAGRVDSFDPLTRSILNVLVHAVIARAPVISPLRAGRRLSARERASLRCIAKGKTVAETGRLLQISPRTVRFHLDNARTKLGVVTRAQAIRKAIRQGIVKK